MDTSPPRDSLSRTLAAWQLHAPRHPQFRARVWQQIGGRTAPLSWAAFARRHVAAVGGVLALAVAVGVVSGQGWARSRVAAESARLATSYVEGLDARSMTSR